MITLSSVSRRHGARVLFAGVSLQITPGRRIALVGPNGAGKTTLLDLIAGDQQPDEGQVNRRRGTVIGYLRQEVVGERRADEWAADPPDGSAAAGRSVLAEVLAATGGVTQLERRLAELSRCLAVTTSGEEQDALLAEYGRVQHRFEHLGGYGAEAQARRVLGGLGFAEDDVARDVAALSGGWRMRVALARLLLAEPDVLLLDEPTNHLDLASVEWLQGFLAGYQGAIVLVSHDRDFVNDTVTAVVELAGGTATEYPGDYAAFVAQREQRAEQLRAAARNQDRRVAQTERFIERFRYKASKARQVQSRIKALERLERVAAPPGPGRTLRFSFPAPPRAGRQVVALESVRKAYGDRVVYDGLDLVLGRGQKVALVGPNGAGKSTLLKLLAGTVSPDAGRRRLGHNVAVAYFAQHQLEALDPRNTVLAELTGVVDTATVNPRALLGAFLFSGDDVDKRVGVLSGGERSRLALAKMLAHPVNLLCMDEPTNHLDITSRDVLEDALAAYPGTVVLITHDRHLIRAVADTIVEVGGGGATVYPGDWDSYAHKTGRDLDARAGPVPAPPVPERIDRKRSEAERRNRVYRRTRELRQRLQAVEGDLVAVEARAAELTRALADPSVYADADGVKALIAEHNAAKDRAGLLFSEWERLSERLEAATAEAGAADA